MSINITIKDQETDLDKSKFFGEILMPESWLMQNIFSPEELYLCQINLEDLYEAVGKTLLPETGMLYFFVEHKKGLNGIVRYYDGELDAYTLFNEEWDENGMYDVFTEWPIFFNEQESLTKLLVQSQNEDEIILLSFDPEFGLDQDFNYLIDKEFVLNFVIKKEDLIKCDFSKVKLVKVKKQPKV